MPSSPENPARAPLCALLLAFSACVLPAAAEGTRTLPGHVPPQIRGAVRLARVPAGEKVELGLVVRVDPALMTRTLAGLYGPGAPARKRFLTPAELARTFDLARKRRALEDFALAAGLTVDPVSDAPGSLLVRVSGPSERVEKAFDVRLDRYRSAGGQAFRANDSDPAVPESLFPHLAAVIGLSDFRGAAKPHVIRGRPPATRAKRARPASSGTASPATWAGGSGPSLGLSPGNIKTIYGFSGSQNGSGQTVALLELDGYASADVGLYESQFGLASPTVDCVSLDGACGFCGPNQTDACDATTLAGGQSDEGGTGDGGMLEVALDIDMVLSLAPSVSKIKVFTALNTPLDTLAAYANIQSDDKAMSASTSWGVDERDATGAGMAAEAAVFSMMAVQGQTLFSAAGDYGAYDASGVTDQNNALVSWAGSLLTNDPSSQPYVTGVGGTSLSGEVGSDSESVWNDGCSSSDDPGVNCQAKGAGGGGIANYCEDSHGNPAACSLATPSSTYWLLPSYQSGVAGEASSVYRNVPDVSLNADPGAAPYSICVGGSCDACAGPLTAGEDGLCDDTCANTCNTLIGGTSAAAPLWASLTALIDQQRASNGLVPLGFANPAFYQLGAGSAHASYFNDIVSGNNGGYSAHSGYDNASGWGSFKASALISVLSSVPSVTSSLSVSGTVGSPLNYDAAASNSPTSFSASGLPPGLSIASGDGVVSGTPSSAGTFDATISAANVAGTGSASVAVFTIVPGAPVTGLTAFTLGVSSIQYSWNAQAGDSGYNLYYATNSARALILATPSTYYTQTGLSANTASGILVYGEYGGVQGTSVFVTTATSAAAPAAPSAVPWVSSAAVSYAACPAQSCSGYLVQASTAANFSGTVLSSATPSTALTSLTVAGLSPLTAYFVRSANVNSLGAPSFGPSVSTETETNLVAPVSPSFSQVSTGSLVFGWGQGGNPGGLAYVAEASTAAGFGGALLTADVDALSAGFSGLAANTSYYFQVAGAGGPPLFAGPQATLAAAPGAQAEAFSGLSTGSFAIAWSSAGNAADTLYQADVSSVADFSSGVVSLRIRATSAAFSGLEPDTLYSARVEAVGRLGSIAGPTPLGSTATLVLPPALPGLSARTTSGFSFSFAAADPPGTRYLVLVSTDPGFSTIAASSNTASSTAAFSGLLSDQLYDVEVAALNLEGSPSSFTAPVATATLAAVPSAALVPVATAAANGLGFAWRAGTLAPGTVYSAQVSSSPVFAAGFVTTSSVTAGVSASFAGLQANTTYYGRVKALASNAPDPDGPFLALPAAATMAAAPSASAAPFLMVGFSSATAAWTPLPLTPPGAADEGCLLQLSTAPDFSSVAASSAVAPGASSATVAGLAEGTAYYARVGSLNWESLPDFLVLGSTVTAAPPSSSGTVAASGLTLTLSRASPQLLSIGVLIPAGAFPAGTPVSAAAEFGPLPPAVTNEAPSITPFGTNIGLVLSASGLQPAVPVTVTMAYDFTQIPPGQSESRLELWRYDPAAGQWTLVPSQDDPVAHVLTARTPHFSTFALFFVAAGTDVNAVQVYPQPWEIGDAASRYWSSVLTFSGLPGGATVKIFAIDGELVWSGDAAASGVLEWNGNNRFGRSAASGTYYASFQSGGRTKVRRLVIIR